MTTEFKKLVGRVDMLEQANRVPRPTGRNVHNEARIERMRKQIERLERIVPTPARLGTIVADQAVVSGGTFSFDSSYPTGGEDFTVPSMPGVVQVVIPGQQGLTFKYDTGSGKVLAYDSSGAEFANGTDLSTFTDIPYLAFSTDVAERLVFRCRDDMLLHKVEIEVGEAFTLNNSNYWTLTLVRRTSEGRRIELGDPLSLQSRSLAADTLVTLYLPDEPLRLNDSDTIHVEIVGTGTPAYLGDLVAWVDARRRTA